MRLPKHSRFFQLLVPEGNVTDMGRTLLLVDDEDIVREITTMMLEDSDFTVFSARSGEEAIEVFSLHKDEIAAAVIDFSMPEMTGYDLALELRKINPQIGIVMISGLAITAEVGKMQADGGLVFISKPFENQTLIKSLNKVLVWTDRKK